MMIMTSFTDFDGVPNNDNLDSGECPDICQSEPGPEISCERS